MPERPGRGIPVAVTCASCDVTSLHRVTNAYATSREQLAESGDRWPEPWDGTYLEPIFTCPCCGADDDYALSPGEQRRVRTLSCTQSGVFRLSDGTIARRPVEALALARAIAGQTPRLSAAWRRLGDLCFRVGLERAALGHWLHAHRLDPTEVHAGASLAWVAHLHGFAELSGPLAAEVLDRHERTPLLGESAVRRLRTIRNLAAPAARRKRARRRVRRGLRT